MSYVCGLVCKVRKPEQLGGSVNDGHDGIRPHNALRETLTEYLDRNGKCLAIHAYLEHLLGT